MYACLSVKEKLRQKPTSYSTVEVVRCKELIFLVRQQNPSMTPACHLDIYRRGGPKGCDKAKID